jgi:hypothetical protein
LTAPVPTALRGGLSIELPSSTLQLLDRRVETIQQHLAIGKRLPRRVGDGLGSRSTPLRPHLLWGKYSELSGDRAVGRSSRS